MNPILLITKDDFAPYAELSINLKEEKKLLQHINNAQELDLRPLLGDQMYYDMLKKSGDHNYAELLNGKEYEDNGVSIQFQGLKPVIVYFAYARYLLVANVQATATGFTQKLNDMSQPIDSRTRTAMIQDAQSIANSYFQRVLTYLNKNKNLFPFWKQGCNQSVQTRRSGAIISRVQNG